MTKDCINSKEIRYRITGCAAHSRLAPLLPPNWIDISSNDSSCSSSSPHFLWENAPRRETKAYRDSVQCYSHLPNGTAILDSKWVLARVMKQAQHDKNNVLATLETHCFRGLSGFQKFAKEASLLQTSSSQPESASGRPQFHDLLNPNRSLSSNDNTLLDDMPNLWVVKDADSNGAGGIWILGSENASLFGNDKTSPLHEEHRYVAQRYAWPPVLFDNRKCHVRVYGLVTCDGRAFVHQRAFLHVANDTFTTKPSMNNDKKNHFESSIHITNCCANSHDANKFAGEICADLEATEFTTIDNNEMVVPLSSFFPSISASVAALSRRTFPFLQNGQANQGFEYLGMDFILSYRNDKPIAYLLEVNAPPSQDTATGLPHAEELHDTVIRDILSLWVLPHITGSREEPGGWRCVYKEKIEHRNIVVNMMAPSKAAILNKIRWAIFERKAARNDKDGSIVQGKPLLDDGNNKVPLEFDTSTTEISLYARRFFPYFNSTQHIFFENGGGSQVPAQVIDMVCASLRNRHRSVIGVSSREAARETLSTILGAKATEYCVFLGSNATSLLSILASQYLRSGFLKESDEIVISSENHMANVSPWLEAAKAVGARVKWWTPTAATSNLKDDNSPDLHDLLTTRTRIVALSHASNILGQVRDIRSLCDTVKRSTNGAAHVVVDGVAAAPHVYPNIEEPGVDWYAISCHKMFGPHLGALAGRKAILTQLWGNSQAASRTLEIGTISYEACAGVYGLGQYLIQLSAYGNEKRERPVPKNPNLEGEEGQSSSQSSGEQPLCREIPPGSTVNVQLNPDHVRKAYKLIATAEMPLIQLLLKEIQRSTKVRVLECQKNCSLTQLPIVSFVHLEISSRSIVEACDKANITARHGAFLSSEHLQQDFDFDRTDGVVRFSLAHYNIPSEVYSLIRLLESLPGWS